VVPYSALNLLQLSAVKVLSPLRGLFQEMEMTLDIETSKINNSCRRPASFDMFRGGRYLHHETRQYSSVAARNSISACIFFVWNESVKRVWLVHQPCSYLCPPYLIIPLVGRIFGIVMPISSAVERVLRLSSSIL
jgi:hypothetical protein